MSYVKNLNNIEKQKKNNVANNITKWVLLFIVLFVISIIIFAFTSIILRGVNTVNSDDGHSWSQILFGDKFDMNNYMAMGIIVFNTIWMAFLVLLVASPISIFTALFITKVLKDRSRGVMVAIVSILAAIPSVVYGAFGKYFILKFMGTIGLSPNQTTDSLLSVVIIVSLMVMPTITLMTTTSILMTDKKMEDSSEALGATKMQTSMFVTLRAAKSGIVVGMMFAIGRCIGEATAISMLSGTLPHAEGVTLNPFHTSLFMSPVIMGALSGASQKEGQKFAYEVLSALLLITVILVFLFVKFIENKTDDNVRSKKHSKKAIKTYNVVKKVNKHGIDSLTSSENGVYERYLYSNEIQNNISLMRSDEISSIYSKTSLDSNSKYASHKEMQSFIYKSLIVIFSMFGVFALASILLFLFNADLSLLFNWEHLTSTGFYSSDDNYIGLGMAMFGTMTNIIGALAIALPIGIAIGIYSNSFLNKDSLMSSIISFAFQIMTSIPAVIYGTLATIIFVSGGFIRNNINSFIPIAMLALVILPTIIKQTQEGFKNVKNSQVEGSYALGATTSYTSTRIVIAQSIPAILSAAILAISIVMADSAIMITILGKPDTPSEMKGWIESGGYTLSTLIYWLSSMANSGEISSRAAAIDQIKVIGIILMVLIFWLTLISQKIKNRVYIPALIMFIGIMLYMTSYFMFGGILIFMIIGLILGIIGAIYSPKGKRI